MVLKANVLIVFFSCLFSVEGICQEKQMQLGIMTYNIRHASPPSNPRVIDIDTVSAVIKKYQPDLVALQEVDVNTGRSGKAINEAEEIGKKTNMYFCFGKAIDFDGGAYGIAILSKYPFDSVKTYNLPSANNHAERRALVLGYINMGRNKKMLFACTHLDAEVDDANRMLQIKAIDSILNFQPFPTVLAGDLNSEAGGLVINALDQHFTRSCLDNCPFTIPSGNPKQTIDFIAYRKPGPYKFTRHRVLQEPYPSDHLPVVAELMMTFKGTNSK